MNKIKKIVLTGGPCAGKTTALVKVIEHFSSLGYKVFTIPEVPTMFSQSGMDYLTKNRALFYEGEKATLEVQLALEDKFQRVDGKTRINVKITETEADVTDLNFLGYQISPQVWQQFVTDSLAYCLNYDIVAVCGSLPRGVSPELFADWLNQLHQAGVKVVLDSSNAALTAGLKAKPWLVKPNHRELEVWVGHPLNRLEEIIAAARQLKAEGIENVIISMGAKGSLWINNEGVLKAEPPKCENVVSTVGAGDSMVAGLIYGFEKGLSKAETLAFATAVSAFAVSQSNVGVSDLSLLYPILEKVQITMIEG